MTTDNFTEAARIIDAHRENERWVGDGVKIECVCGHTSHATYDFSGPITEDKNNHRDAERMHAVHVAQVLAAQEPTGLDAPEAHRKIAAEIEWHIRTASACGYARAKGTDLPDGVIDAQIESAVRAITTIAARAAQRDEEKR